MIGFIFLAALIFVQAVLAVPTPGKEIIKRQSYTWQNWSEGSGSWVCSNLSGGIFSARWTGYGAGGFVCGKGWTPGGSRTVSFTGTYNPRGPGFLTLYGWTQNPLIEFYVVEAHGDLAPNEPWTPMGTFTSSEGTYEMFRSTRVNMPSIEGTRTFDQFWSVRTVQRTGGVITTGRHFEEWARVGMNLGRHNYMVIAVEGFANGSNLPSGDATITVGVAPTTTAQTSVTPNTPATTTGTSTTTSSGGTCAARWGQCGGSGWTGPTCCQSGSTCQAQNQWYSQCL